jgi:hypothetical protein
VNHPSNSGLNLGIAAGNANGEIRRNVIRHYAVWTGVSGRGITTGGRSTPGDFKLDIYENQIHDTQIAIATGALQAPRLDASGNPAQPDGTATWPFRVTATGRIHGNEISHYEYHAITAFHGSRGWELWHNHFTNGPRGTGDWGAEWVADVLLMKPGVHAHIASPDGWGSQNTSVKLFPGQTVANPGNVPATVVTEP